MAEAQGESQADLLVDELFSALGETPCANDILLLSDRAALTLIGMLRWNFRQVNAKTRVSIIHFHAGSPRYSTLQASVYGNKCCLCKYARVSFLCSEYSERRRSTTTEVLFLIRLMEV